MTSQHGRLRLKDRQCHVLCTPDKIGVDCYVFLEGLLWCSPSSRITWRFYLAFSWRSHWHARWCNSYGQNSPRVKLSLMVEWPSGKVVWKQNVLRWRPVLWWFHPNWVSCNCRAKSPTVTKLLMQDTKFWLLSVKPRFDDFTAKWIYQVKARPCRSTSRAKVSVLKSTQLHLVERTSHWLCGCSQHSGFR